MCRKKSIIITIILTIFTSGLMAKDISLPGIQDTTRYYQPGKSYTYNVTSPLGEYALAIEYIAGDPKSKLILTSPHGGSLKPDFLRTRTKDYVVKADNEYGDTESFSGVSDSKTLELTQALAQEIKRTTGLRPHIILNHLHRSKLDANRAMSLAAQGDVNTEAAWKAFHAYIDDAKTQVLKNHEGLLFDIHGNAHRPQRTEVGLLIKGKDFISEDLEQYVDRSSLKAMVRTGKATMTELIKGDYAMGTLLSEKGILATPGKSVPNPVNEGIFPDGRYFNGGYNTARHGSKFSGNISAIQLEFNSDVRMDDQKRAIYVKSITQAINQFMKKYFK